MTFEAFIAPRSAHLNVQKAHYRSKAVAWRGVLVKWSNPHLRMIISGSQLGLKSKAGYSEGCRP